MENENNTFSVSVNPIPTNSAPVKKGSKKWMYLLLLIVLAGGGYWCYKRFVPQHSTAPTAEDKKAYSQFSTLLKSGQSYTEAYPISKETPVNFPSLSAELVGIISRRAVTSVKASNVEYADGGKGSHAEYTSAEAVDAERKLLITSMITTESPRVQTYVKDGMAYLSQELEAQMVFAELKSSEGGIKVDIYTRPK
jgi:hypothetical protein